MNNFLGNFLDKNGQDTRTENGLETGLDWTGL